MQEEQINPLLPIDCDPKHSWTHGVVSGGFFCRVGEELLVGSMLVFLQVWVGEKGRGKNNHRHPEKTAWSPSSLLTLDTKWKPFELVPTWGWEGPLCFLPGYSHSLNLLSLSFLFCRSLESRG